MSWDVTSHPSRWGSRVHEDSPAGSLSAKAVACRGRWSALQLGCFPRGGSEEPKETEQQHRRQQAGSRTGSRAGGVGWGVEAVSRGSWPQRGALAFCPARNENRTISPLSCAASLSSPRYPDIRAVEREGTGS